MRRRIFGFILTLSLLAARITHAQTEYIVTVNPVTGAVNKIDSIPGVTYLRGYYMPAYSEFTKQYTFAGKDSNFIDPYYLYTVDAISGQTLYNPLFQQESSFYHMIYANQSSDLYGIMLAPGSFNTLVKIDKTNSTYVPVKNFPDIQALIKLIMDDANNRFFILGQSNNVVNILTYELSSGNLLSQFPVNNIRFPVYRRSTNKFYGILITQPPQGGHQQFQLAEIDQATGTIIPKAILPNIAGFTPGCETFDEINGRYFFSGFEWLDGSNYLYTIDINTGNIINKARVPQKNIVSEDNLILFRYDNNLGKLFALFWEAHTSKTPPLSDSTCRLDSAVKIYSNTAGSLVINKSQTSCKVSLNVYNMLGQALIREKLITDGHNEIPFSHFPAGVYMCELVSNGKAVFIKKIFHP